MTKILWTDSKSIKLHCIVKADPEDIHFRWSALDLHNKSIKLNPQWSQVYGLRSELNLSPETIKEVSSVQCIASNRVGLQNLPCSFQVVLGSTYKIYITLKHFNPFNILSPSQNYMAVLCNAIKSTLQRFFSMKRDMM